MRVARKIIMVSGCLLGIRCRFDGTAREMPELLEILKDYSLVPFCPEASGGLTIPRLPAEIQNGDGAAVLDGTAMVINQAGCDCTMEYVRGAENVLAMVEKFRPQFIVLKAKSPSCGVGKIYDGSFKGKLRDGDGVTTALLRRSGVIVYSEGDVLSGCLGKK